MVHVSNIQQGARANSASDLLRRGQPVKVKVMSVAGGKYGLSIKDVDQISGRDLTPHLRIKTDSELEEERRELSRASSGTNSIPLGSKNDGPVRSARRLTSPERWEIKQLISSGAVDPADYPDLNMVDDVNDPVVRAEVDEDMDIEVREDEPAFLAGQTKRTLNLSPVKIVKAPDGSLNRAALLSASLAKERRELQQQESNEQADSEVRDLITPWLDPMAKDSDRAFSEDYRGNTKGKKAADGQSWMDATYNKASSYGIITNLSIQEQRQSLPIYKLREPLLKAIAEVSTIFHVTLLSNRCFRSTRSW
jgi:ATP-dependent RNA helicase DHX8/PRP22